MNQQKAYQAHVLEFDGLISNVNGTLAILERTRTTARQNAAILEEILQEASPLQTMNPPQPPTHNNPPS